MNYILYLGPDDFRGLMGMPEEPKEMTHKHQFQMKNRLDQLIGEKLKNFYI